MDSEISITRVGQEGEKEEMKNQITNLGLVIVPHQHDAYTAYFESPEELSEYACGDNDRLYFHPSGSESAAQVLDVADEFPGDVPDEIVQAIKSGKDVIETVISGICEYEVVDDIDNPDCHIVFAQEVLGRNNSIVDIFTTRAEVKEELKRLKSKTPQDEHQLYNRISCLETIFADNVLD